MNKLLKTIVFIITLLMGLSLIMFVVRIIWMPPSSLGMMMNKAMIMHHMSFWLEGTFVLILLLILIIIVINLLISKKHKSDK